MAQCRVDEKSRVVSNPVQTRTGDRSQPHRYRAPPNLPPDSSARGLLGRSAGRLQCDEYGSRIRGSTPREWPRWRGFSWAAVHHSGSVGWSTRPTCASMKASRSACQLSDHHFALRTAFTLVARLEALAPTTLTGEPG
jgi:hypothetical protein